MKFYGTAKGRVWRTKQPQPTEEQLSVKRCFRCGQVLPIDEFRIQRQSDGFYRHKNICTNCDRRTK